MNKHEFRMAIKRNGLTCDEFAAIVGRNLSTIYTFGNGNPVPYYARLILRLLDERGGSQGLISKIPENTRKIP